MLDEVARQAAARAAAGPAEGGPDAEPALQQQVAESAPSSSTTTLTVSPCPPLPVGSPAQAHTMVESQRQQAMLLMGQLNKMNAAMGKAQTLRPTGWKEAKRSP